MNRRNLILEWIWSCGGRILYIPIATAAVVAGINVYMLFSVNQSDACKAEIITDDQEQCQEALYIEETRLSGAEMTLYEISQDEPTGGYLVTEEMAMVAQLVQAEAGNQDLKGKRLVADVVLNRVDSEKFPNTIEEVIFQKNPVQFSVTVSGAFERAGGDVSEECFESVRMEWERGTRIDGGVLYFNSIEARGKNPFKYGDHWFSY